MTTSPYTYSITFAFTSIGLSLLSSTLGLALLMGPTLVYLTGADFFLNSASTIEAYGEQPTIGYLNKYVPATTATPYHKLEFATWGSKGTGSISFGIRTTPTFSIYFGAITGPAGEKIGRRCGRVTFSYP